jgi:hypothetical protein
VKAQLLQAIRQSKRTIWGNYNKDIMGSEVWRVAQYMNHQAGTSVEALTGRDDTKANTSLGKEEMIRTKLFPLNDGDKYCELPPVRNAHTRVTDQAV